jgi:hypothetical protein
MVDIVTSLVPAFTCGFAVQQALEIVDSFVSLPVYEKHKKTVLKTVSVLLGILIARYSSLRVLAALGMSVAEWMEIPATALVIGAATEGINSILKFLAYAKQNEKAEAAQSTSASGDINLKRMDRK